MHPVLVKAKAIVHYTHFLPSIRKVASIYNVSKSTVQRWVRSETAGGARKRRTSKQIAEHIRMQIKEVLDANPFVTQREIAEYLGRSCGIRMSQSSASRWIQRIGYSRKKAFRVVDVSHDPQKICHFASEYQASRSHSRVICVDETCFYVGDRRKHGYSPRGQRLHQRASRTLRRSKLTLIMAIAETGVVHYEVLEGNCNRETFCTFLNEMPAGPNTTVLMDNVAFHHSKSTKELITSKGWIPLYIPPYSPKLNAIENVFGYLKNTYRSATKRDRTSSREAMTSILDRMRDADLTNFFARVDRYVVDILQTFGHGFCGYDSGV